MGGKGSKNQTKQNASASPASSRQLVAKLPATCIAMVANYLPRQSWIVFAFRTSQALQHILLRSDFRPAASASCKSRFLRLLHRPYVCVLREHLIWCDPITGRTLCERRDHAETVSNASTATTLKIWNSENRTLFPARLRPLMVMQDNDTVSMVADPTDMREARSAFYPRCMYTGTQQLLDNPNKHPFMLRNTLTSVDARVTRNFVVADSIYVTCVFGWLRITPFAVFFGWNRYIMYPRPPRPSYVIGDGVHKEGFDFGDELSRQPLCGVRVGNTRVVFAARETSITKGAASTTIEFYHVNCAPGLYAVKKLKRISMISTPHDSRAATNANDAKRSDNSEDGSSNNDESFTDADINEGAIDDAENSSDNNNNNKNKIKESKQQTAIHASSNTKPIVLSSIPADCVTNMAQNICMHAMYCEPCSGHILACRYDKLTVFITEYTFSYRALTLRQVRPSYILHLSRCDSLHCKSARRWSVQTFQQQLL